MFICYILFLCSIANAKKPKETIISTYFTIENTQSSRRDENSKSCCDFYDRDGLVKSIVGVCQNDKGIKTTVNAKLQLPRSMTTSDLKNMNICEKCLICAEASVEIQQWLEKGNIGKAPFDCGIGMKRGYYFIDTPNQLLCVTYENYLFTVFKKIDNRDTTKNNASEHFLHQIFSKPGEDGNSSYTFTNTVLPMIELRAPRDKLAYGFIRLEKIKMQTDSSTKSLNKNKNNESEVDLEGFFESQEKATQKKNSDTDILEKSYVSDCITDGEDSVASIETSSDKEEQNKDYKPTENNIGKGNISDSASSRKTSSSSSQGDFSSTRGSSVNSSNESVKISSTRKGGFGKKQLYVIVTLALIVPILLCGVLYYYKV
ncbi:hypothetical protein PAEPH01_1319 [Pancytospora epiphaga]|nr:hypothetical protein PAEPH01_1319 [Pancytospora epiphaga]